METLAGILATPFASNLAVAIFGLFAVFAFRALARQLNIKNEKLAVAVFAFLPLFWVNSASTMDYVPAICLAISAFAAIGYRRPIIAGMLFGIAIGFRPATLVLLPGLFAYGHIAGAGKRNFLMLPGIFGFIALFFLPILSIRGWSGFVPVGAAMGFERRMLFAAYRALGAFGTLGWIAIIIGLTTALFGKREKSSAFRLLLLTAPLFIVVWLILPHEAGYWIAILPFVILAIFGTGGKRQYLYAILLLLPAFIDIGFRAKLPDKYEFGPKIAAGMVISDYRVRRDIVRLREELPALELPDNSIVITGRSAALFEINDNFTAHNELCGHDIWISKRTKVRFVDNLPGYCADSLLSIGTNIYILQSAVPAVNLVHRWRPVDFGAVVLSEPDFR